jgi:AAA15 family ATPase/GTPase
LGNINNVNLIAGQNNVGKTALLEAIFLHEGSSNPQLSMRINNFRGLESIVVEFGYGSQKPFDSIFYDLDNTQEIEIASRNERNKEKLLKIRLSGRKQKFNKRKGKMRASSKRIEDSSSWDISETNYIPALDFEETLNGHKTQYQMRFTPEGIEINRPPQAEYPTFFIPSRRFTSLKEDAKLFGKIDQTNYSHIEKILDILKLVDSRLKRISVVPVGDDVTIHGDIGLNRSIPLPLMGEGLNRLNSILLRIANAENGVVLIDEIETGFHFSILEDIWRVIQEAVNTFNVQIFATTHSFECIKAAHTVFSKCDDYKFSLHRLYRIDETVQVKTLSNLQLETAISANLEVR